MNEITVGCANSLANLEPIASSPHRMNESVNSVLFSGVACRAELLRSFSLPLGSLGCDRTVLYQAALVVTIGYILSTVTMPFSSEAS